MAFTLPFLGSGLNQIVMNANNHKMPVALNHPIDFDSRHCLLTNQSRYPVLADVFLIDHAVYSIGDFLIFSHAYFQFASIFLLTIWAIWVIVKE